MKKKVIITAVAAVAAALIGTGVTWWATRPADPQPSAVTVVTTPTTRAPAPTPSASVSGDATYWLVRATWLYQTDDYRADTCASLDTLNPRQAASAVLVAWQRDYPSQDIDWLSPAAQATMADLLAEECL